MSQVNLRPDEPIDKALKRLKKHLGNAEEEHTSRNLQQLRDRK
jgi:ribosomal protein S21